MKDSVDFLRDLAASRLRVNQFAVVQKLLGFSIWMPPETTRPTEAERFNYSDDGDLMIAMRVEHKSRTFNFTSREDFPYPTLIVDEKYKEDKKTAEKGPLGVCIVESGDAGCVAVVYGWTRSRWRVEKIWDKKQKRECEFYTVDLKIVRFCKPDDVF